MALERSEQITLFPMGNPVLVEHEARIVDLEQIESPVIHHRHAPTKETRMKQKRLLLDSRRVKRASEAIEKLALDVEIYGFTKGQFSLLDLLGAVLEITGPAQLDLSTWTAARHEIERLAELHRLGKMTEVRFLMDASFARRDPTAAHMIRQAFGVERVRIAQTHAKFALFGNAKWKLVLHTSMNLNMNPRFEDFQLAHDPDIFDFVARIMDEVWAKQKNTLRREDAAEARKVFARDL